MQEPQGERARLPLLTGHGSGATVPTTSEPIQAGLQTYKRHAGLHTCPCHLMLVHLPLLLKLDPMCKMLVPTGLHRRILACFVCAP